MGELSLRQIPAIVAAVQQGAEQGMGHMRLKSRVCRVTALRSSGLVLDGPCTEDPCLAEEQGHGDNPVLTWQSYRLEDVMVDYGKATRWAEACRNPVRSLGLRFLSPVKIKERGQWVEEPFFSPVIKVLVRRLRLLSQVHGGSEWPQSEFGPLLDLAEAVRMEHDETFWTGHKRHSKKSGRQEVEGFVGQAWYAGEDLSPLLPILWLGQWLHMGKGYVLGNGRYVIELVS